MGARGDSETAAVAAAITRRSGSNLAAAFFVLPRERRRDMEVLYAFCRVVDDWADAPGVAPAAQRAALGRWRASLGGPVPGEEPLAAAVRELAARRRIATGHLEDIVDGVMMDLEPRRFADFAALAEYCRRVACAVGLASIEIFGYTDARCREYAVALGMALQLTNILRDVGVDWDERERIYLPVADMARHGYGEEALRRRETGPEFRALMAFEADRARAFFAEAARLLPAADRRSLVVAESMRLVYRRLLEQMSRDGFAVFGRRYRVGWAGKLAAVAAAVWRGWVA